MNQTPLRLGEPQRGLVIDGKARVEEGTRWQLVFFLWLELRDQTLLNVARYGLIVAGLHGE